MRTIITPSQPKRNLNTLHKAKKMTPSNVTAATVQNPHSLETLEVNDLALPFVRIFRAAAVPSHPSPVLLRRFVR